MLSSAVKDWIDVFDVPFPGHYRKSELTTKLDPVAFNSDILGKDGANASGMQCFFPGGVAEAS